MKPGSWPSILGVYLAGVCGASTVSKLIPLAGDIARDFQIVGSDFGWLVALVALPAAIFAIPSGMVVDTWGSRRVLIGAGILGVIANGIYLIADSLPVIMLARLAEGLAVVHIYSAAPAFLIATVKGKRLTNAMTLWSTYAPVGTAIGLAIGGIFAETAIWRMTFVGHGLLFALAGLMAALQSEAAPAKRAAKSLGARLTDLFSAFVRPQLLTLGIAFLAVVSLGVGANLTLPLFIARVHDLSPGSASSIVASATLVMVLGSGLSAALLGRGIATTKVFAVVTVIGFTVGALSFWPELSLTARIGVMLVWFLMSGASLAAILAALPAAADPERPGAAAGLINLAGALAALLNPPLWIGIFESGRWQSFPWLMAAGWLTGLVMIWLVFRLIRPADPAAQAAPSEMS